MKIADLAGVASSGEQTGACILVVDDDVAVLEIVSESLEDLGYRVMGAGDAAEALTVLSATSGIDLMLSDINMPAMSGVELAHEAVALYPALKVVLMSGYADPAPSNRLVLHKPFSIRKLAETLQAIILTDK